VDESTEYLKLLYDISKHLTTLGTVTAVIMIALSEHRGAPYGPLLLKSLSVFLALAAMGILARYMAWRVGFSGRWSISHGLLQLGSVVLLVAAVAWFAVLTLG
jgi:hypothetical protein